MEPGFRLDYVYYYKEDFTGQPMPCGMGLAERNKPANSSYDGARAAANAFLHIRTDYAPDAFLELDLLHVMGEQFSLVQHALTVDDIPICGRDTLGNLLAAIKESTFIGDDQVVPEVAMGDATVTISILTFTKWGGLFRNTYRFSRNFPHTFEGRERQCLIEFYIPVVF